MHKTIDRFWKCFYKLPENVQKLAKENFELLKRNPKHQSLHFKKIGKLWSARVGLNYRALAVPDGEDFIWVWIGTHDEYDRMLKVMS
jgi:mRNA-degrading endonuclease RelE of RelBE toxin-antitoxin system